MVLGIMPARDGVAADRQVGTDVQRPLTFPRPHMVLFVNENDDRFGSSVHVPTACGLFKSSVTLGISRPL